jgi:hypothetical protein
MERGARRLLLQQPPSMCRLLFTYHNKRSRFIQVVDHDARRRPDHLLVLMEVSTNDTFLKIVVTTIHL